MATAVETVLLEGLSSTSKVSPVATAQFFSGRLLLALKWILAQISELNQLLQSLDRASYYAVMVLSIVCLYFSWIPNVVNLTHAPETVLLNVYDSVTEKLESLSLSSFVRRHCPSLSSSFFPTPYLLSGHHQTIFAGLVSRFCPPEPDIYEREIVSLPHGGRTSIDWSKGYKDLPANTPIIILQHGIDGNSRDRYILALLPHILKNGYKVASLNGRGQANVEITTPLLYNGAYTEDARFLMKHIQQQNPDAALIGIGFSLGANIMMKCVGEDGDACPLVGFVSVGNPFDLHMGLNRLHSTFLGRHLYSRVMTLGLVRTFKSHLKVFMDNLDHASFAEPIDADKALNSTYLHEFDDAITRRVLGFRSVSEYYRKGSSSQYILDIRVPTLILSDIDDPIVASDLIPFSDVLGNPNVILATTKRGGHLGWFEGVFKPTRWFPKPVMEFVNALLKAQQNLPPNMKRTLMQSTFSKDSSISVVPKDMSVQGEPAQKPSQKELDTESMPDTSAKTASTVVANRSNIGSHVLTFASRFIPARHASESANVYKVRKFVTYLVGVWALFLAAKKRTPKRLH
ncbi:alpha/beta-hydrolase [Rhizoclosmatium globosum]|uniref:Alpha/beta-hydrolase n=1 Tax=Rhizoclosmatium globosum TaxID=329046 RepID=A0A1Y2CR40_9FUNG|nr:hypothetical protein HDU99_007779 [Rhizoclosmatium hyalinum]KAJ3281885.1 hypothetical protein HDU79_010431 [Rhizoclosmatium sp. JEL0117]ORY49508.1 alpha/beta-hydrolase [Rhizoclosmatium globosum]|eukprot:ORY49508.1 alpha/beta-hydrolase [Rhizoclosmatium globosum]